MIILTKNIYLNSRITFRGSKKGSKVLFTWVRGLLKPHIFRSNLVHYTIVRQCYNVMRIIDSKTIWTQMIACEKPVLEMSFHCFRWPFKPCVLMKNVRSWKVSFGTFRLRARVRILVYWRNSVGTGVVFRAHCCSKRWAEKQNKTNVNANEPNKTHDFQEKRCRGRYSQRCHFKFRQRRAIDKTCQLWGKMSIDGNSKRKIEGS